MLYFLLEIDSDYTGMSIETALTLALLTSMAFIAAGQWLLSFWYQSARAAEEAEALEAPRVLTRGS